MSIWSSGSVLGIALGFAGGGIFAAHYGWRPVFFVTAVPAVILAILAFRLREPLRGAAEPGGPRLRHVRDASIGNMLRLLRIKTLRDTLLSQTALFFVLGANAFWLPTLLIRRFGMGVGEAGTLSGGVIVIGGLVGTLVGGWAADWRRKTSPRADLEVSIVGFVAGSVLIGLALVAPQPWFVLLFLLTVISLYLYSGPFTAIGQNVVVPSLRGSAVTITLLVAHLFGDAFAAAIVGFLSDTLGGLQTALLIVSPALLLLAAGLAAMALGSIESDTLRMEREWAERGEASQAAVPAAPAARR
jgi:sugar phosphate permease